MIKMKRIAALSALLSCLFFFLSCNTNDGGCHGASIEGRGVQLEAEDVKDNNKTRPQWNSNSILVVGVPIEVAQEDVKQQNGSSQTDLDQFSLDQPHLASLQDSQSKSNPNLLKLPEQIKNMIDLLSLLNVFGLPTWNRPPQSDKFIQESTSTDSPLFKWLVHQEFQNQNSSNNVDELIFEFAR